MPKYKKCPRCELNYIEEDKDYCDVCLAEMQGGKLRFADLEEDEEEVEKTELCPVCGENYMRPGEKMCDECRQNADNYAEEEDIDPEKD
ncbi:MAG TPA: zinc ribbon domain-containing protein [Candidatus Borkfalkia faecigallinarum]|uniref:Zinc ribbon domain-containing protein n=1 Tax=Candidatus Borkfalkia faecigallinarum TaxID=2838509 RepID=A0A9D1VUA4_9FIRM|nr:zinc ribbon domain-containing protein [Candidatus Borkfalkia faecigallinarum]